MSLLLECDPPLCICGRVLHSQMLQEIRASLPSRRTCVCTRSCQLGVTVLRKRERLCWRVSAGITDKLNVKGGGEYSPGGERRGGHVSLSPVFDTLTAAELGLEFLNEILKQLGAPNLLSFQLLQAFSLLQLLR